MAEMQNNYHFMIAYTASKKHKYRYNISHLCSIKLKIFIIKLHLSFGLNKLK